MNEYSIQYKCGVTHPRISIIIACMNSHDLFINIIRLFEMQSFKDFEVIIIDNASSPFLSEFLYDIKVSFNLHIIRVNENIGFAGGINLGVSKASTEIIVVLNVDMYFKESFLDIIYNNFMSYDRNVLITSFHIKTYKSNNTESFGVYLTHFIRAKNALNLSSKILGPHGAAFAFRKDLLERIKIPNGLLFDERYFFLWEDVELALRCNHKGIKTFIMNDVECFHLGNSSNSNYFYKQYMSMKNRFLLINDYFDNYFLKYFHVFIMYDIPRLIFFILFNPFRSRLFFINKF